MKLKLSSKEWIQLIDGQSDDSELPTYCANVAALRNALILICRHGRNKEIMDFQLTDLKKKIKWVEDGHKLSPLLKKICRQIGYDESKHTPQAAE